MQAKHLLLPVVCISLLSGCGMVRNIAGASPLAPSISFRVVSPASSHTGRFNIRAQNHVFRTQQEVDSFLATVPVTAFDGNGNQVSETLPAIDFSKEVGILVLFGAQSDGGYSGDISAIEEKQDRLIVHPLLWTHSNEPGVGYTMAIVYPYKYVAIPISSKPIEFASTVDRPRPSPWWSIFY